MSNIIETFSLTKKYNGTPAVNKVNMRIEKGEIYGLIGKNGAGKTTTMKMILGIITPNEGSIELFGSTNLNDERKKIGSLIEEPGLYKNADAFENLKRFSILYGGTDEEINNLIELVGLKDAKKKKVKEYSLGMKQRLGIALSLLGHPELLILDEPINGLDPAGIKEIRDLIIKLNQEYGITFMISSHLLDELGKVATKYGIINRGILIEEITKEELDKRCNKGLLLEVSDTKQAIKLLNINGYADVDENGNEILIRGENHNNAAINRLLVENGIDVSNITTLNYSSEDYFIERMGK